MRRAKLTWWVAGIATVLMAAPAAADDAACDKAVREHGDFKAVLDADQTGKPQFETVRHAADGTIEVTRYVDGEKRLVRKMLAGVFAKESDSYAGANVYRFAYSHSIDVAKLLPLKPDTSAKYTIIVVRENTFDPQISDATLTASGEREAMLGGCRLRVIDLVLHTVARGKPITSTTTLAFSPDLAYPIDSSVEYTNNGKTTIIKSKLQAVEAMPQDGKSAPASP